MSYGWPSSISGSNWGPPTCFQVCGNIRGYGMSLGNDPTVCDSDSSFLDDYAKCLACVKDYPSPEISAHLEEVGPEYREYCKSLEKPAPSALTSTVVFTLNNTPETVPITTTFGSTTLAASITTSSTSSVSSSTSSISSATSASTTPASPQTTSNSPSFSAHLPNQSSIIGAAVGGTAGGFILAFVIGFMWYRRRKQRREKQPEQPQEQQAEEGSAGVGGGIASPTSPKESELAESPVETKTWQELDNNPYYEMDATHAAVELRGAEHAAELDDTSKRRSQMVVKNGDSPIIP